MIRVLYILNIAVMLLLAAGSSYMIWTVPISRAMIWVYLFEGHVLPLISGFTLGALLLGIFGFLGKQRGFNLIRPPEFWLTLGIVIFTPIYLYVYTFEEGAYFYGLLIVLFVVMIINQVRFSLGFGERISEDT